MSENATILKIADLKEYKEHLEHAKSTKERAQLKHQLSKELIKASPYLLGKNILGFNCIS